MKTIALEEHFVTESFLRATGAYGKAAPPQLAELQPKLLDLGAGRGTAMDEAGIDLQVMSLAAMSLARDVNDELAAAVWARPNRLGGFATLGLREPEKAAAELEGCVRSFGFRGALVDGTVGGLFLDDVRFLPVFEAAATLGVPVYLHPAPPPDPVKAAYFSGLPNELGELLSIASWGWHAETGLHTLRLIVVGVFDRVPGLQLMSAIWARVRRMRWRGRAASSPPLRVCSGRSPNTFIRISI